MFIILYILFFYFVTKVSLPALAAANLTPVSIKVNPQQQQSQSPAAAKSYPGVIKVNAQQHQSQLLKASNSTLAAGNLIPVSLCSSTVQCPVQCTLHSEAQYAFRAILTHLAFFENCVFPIIAFVARPATLNIVLQIGNGGKWCFST